MNAKPSTLLVILQKAPGGRPPGAFLVAGPRQFSGQKGEKTEGDLDKIAYSSRVERGMIGGEDWIGDVPGPNSRRNRCKGDRIWKREACGRSVFQRLHSS